MKQKYKIKELNNKGIRKREIQKRNYKIKENERYRELRFRKKGNEIPKKKRLKFLSF